ncbi:MAG: CHASE domain-containing protein [Bacillota bacterium]
MRHTLSNRAWIPWFVLGIALLATAAGTLYVHQINQHMEQARFQVAVQDAQDKINARIETYVSVLRATCGLFAGSETVSRDEFHAYVEQLRLSAQYPGIQGIGFTQRVLPSEKDAFIAEMNREGVTRLEGDRVEPFGIWPGTPRKEYHAIVYLEPLDRRNHTAIGYDMFTEPTRARAMALARDTGAAAMSGKVRLVQEIDSDVQAGFLIYLPVYRGGTVPASVKERREKLVGFVYSPFRAGDLLKGILGHGPHSNIEYAIYDGQAVEEESLLYCSNPEVMHQEPGQARSTTRVIQSNDSTWKDRPWTAVFTTSPEFDSLSGSTLERSVPIAGCLISGVLFFLTRTQARALAERQRAAEERLKLLSREQEARHEAERANRLKDEFLATVSHELRTPLNAILGWTQLLGSGNVDASLIREGLEAIDRNSKAQSQLIEDLLDVSRIIAGRLRLRIEKTDLAGVIESAIDTVRHAAEAKEIELVKELDRSVDPIMGDSVRLQQVTWNLLSNAIKFTPRGGRVEVRLQRAGDCDVELIVRDSGQGIPAEFLPYVFDRFSQADTSSTRRHGGLGLGLAITRHLVELHGGTIEAYSDGVGKGAMFTVRLPIHSDGSNATGRESEKKVGQAIKC